MRTNTSDIARSDASATSPERATLRLLVRNHPGVMSHICGLFARRAFNVEAIFCVPIGDGKRSKVVLVVNEDDRLEQLVRQLRKLEDVIEIDRSAEKSIALEIPADFLK